MNTFASDQEINTVAIRNPLSRPLIDAYRETTKCDDVPKTALEFCDAVNTMLGLHYDADRESVISDLRWLGDLLKLAADNIEGHR